MLITADYYMIDHGDAEQPRCFDKTAGKVDVGAAWLRIAAGVVVGDDQEGAS